MTWWAEFPWGAALTFLGLFSALLLLAMDERNRRKFVSCEDAEGMRKRLEKELKAIHDACERQGNMMVLVDDRVGDLEEKSARIEERQTQQWERISEQMANTAQTIKEVAAELKEISRMQQEHALRLERIHRGEAP